MQLFDPNKILKYNYKGGSKNGLGAGTSLPISMKRVYLHFKV